MQKNTLFASPKTKKKATVQTPELTTNNAGGVAYSLNDKLTLARIVHSSFFGKTFYTEAKDQLETVIQLAYKVDTEFLAACAVYAREVGHMKDTPAALLAVLRKRDKAQYRKVFNRVISDGRMLRGFVGMVRSGKFGSKNMVHADRQLINRWLLNKTPVQVWNDSIGNSPSLGDVIRLAHPSSNGDVQREAVYKLICKNEVGPNLPQPIKDYFTFSKARTETKADLVLPSVSFMRLTSLELTPNDWKQLGENMTWNQVRQNINTLERHGVLEDKPLVKKLAEKLTDENAIEKAKVFPYQVYTSILNVKNTELKNALQDALDKSVKNIPNLPDNTVVAFDISGSMGSPVNGNNVNGGLKCSQVAGLMALSIYKKNPSTRLITFDSNALEVTNSLNSRDSIMTNMGKVNFNGGATACSSSVILADQKKIPCDLFIMISDSESWADYGNNRWGTATKEAWNRYKKSNPKAKLVLIDLQAPRTSQMPEADDVLFLSGYSESLFSVIGSWYEGGSDKDFVSEILSHSSTNQV